ncbi:MAG: RDD family protein [Nocardioides sp.]
MSASTSQASMFPAAELDRRFYAFVIDRLIAWALDGLAVFAAYRLFLADGRVLSGLALILCVVLLVGLALAVPLGLRGVSPGKAALGLRVVGPATGEPIGVVQAMLRSLVLGLASLPTFGLGLATLAWTAVTDPGRQRRGWHDHVAESVVVDVRPVPVEVERADKGPRQIVNLTAMRLVPASAPTAPVVPSARMPRVSQQPADAAPPTAPVALAQQGPLPTAPAGPAEPASERTVVRTGATPLSTRWRVTFDTGETFAVEGLSLVGRRPEPRPGEQVSHLVPLPSGDMSLSNTHAQFQVARDGVLVVVDRGSTNGSVLVRSGVTRELPAGKPTTLLPGDVVRFGDRQMTVARES